ncbi:MAG: PAS domain S-box protein [Proteobacteria bacterium]|nr:PAS domain S-box protein [Pseudomonadota bacterium]
MTVFVCMMLLQVTVAAFSIELLSAVRSYVAGESLYSKGQKDAQIYLLDYAEYHREEDYRRFVAALAVPRGDRTARVELQKDNPDIAVAQRGFIEGGNHPADVGGLIWLFRWFHRSSLMAEAIAAWTEGDRIIDEMQRLAERARERIQAGEPDAPAVREMLQRAPQLNREITALEARFSAELGVASRRTQQLLIGLNVLIAAVLTVTGLVFVRYTSRIQAHTEAEVIRRQESLQRLLDSIAEGLYGVDLGGRCTFANRAALRLLGYDDEAELIGKHMATLLGHDGKDERAPRESHAVGDTVRRRDGSTFPVELRQHPVLDEGVVQGAVVTFFDISERVRMQDALRRGELRMERLVDAVTDGVITVDEERNIVVFNRAAETLFGVAAADAIGSGIDRYIAGGGALPAPGTPRTAGTLHELTGKRANGEAFPLEASLSQLQIDDRLLTTVVLRDVTALHMANAERQARLALEAASEAKTEFLSRMSHELRTPLNAVLGFAQLLRVDTKQPPSAKQMQRIEHIENAGAHLLALVNDVLDLSRVESGEMSVTEEAVDLALVAEEASTMISPLVTQGGIELINSSLPDADHAGLARFGATLRRADEVWVLADRVRLRQVLVNLLSNAVKYNRQGGSVALSWKVADRRCEVTIADTGCGIAPEDLQRLFEPFNRLGAEASRVEGTGIGLVLSRRLMRLMGGELTIGSAVGQGTTATLTLRLARAPAPVRAVASPSRPGVLGGSLDVLYAEDNEVNAELVRQIVGLRPAVTLRIAENGRTALRMAHERPPELMLVDMHLGDMTGLELAHALRSSQATQQIKLVALSADALPEQIETAMSHGFENYLTKPVDFRQLLDLLDDHIRLR